MNQLEIGIGDRERRPGWVTNDLTPGPNVDLPFDASKPDWPVRPGSFVLIEAKHVIEHLPNFWGFFEGAWVALKDYGIVHLRLPYGASEDAFGDPTHLRAYYPFSFCAVQPGYADSVFNPQQRNWNYPFKLEQAMIRIRPEFRLFLRKPLRSLTLKAIPYIWNSCVEQIVILRKIPRGAKLAMPANCVSLGYCMDMKDYYGPNSKKQGLLVF